MCRNIRVLHHFEPPTTESEIHAAALQYVRKVSGVSKPSAANLLSFERAVAEVARITTTLLGELPQRGTPRTREGERAKATQRGLKRQQRAAAAGP
jgi:hypothetical protein